jgi:hypothetical protein
MKNSRQPKFRIEKLEERIAPTVVLGFNAHHDTVVTSGGGPVVLGFNAHHDTIVSGGNGPVVLGANAHHDTIVTTGGCGCSSPKGW